MKKAGIIISTLLLLSSCTLEEILDELSPDMTAKLDGTEWKATVPYAVLEDGKFIITGLSMSGETVSITVNGSESGTYNLNLTSAQCAAVYKESTENSLDDAYYAVSGKIILSRVDPDQKTVSGTFNFSVIRDITEPAIEITEGKFSDLGYSVEE